LQDEVTTSGVRPYDKIDLTTGVSMFSENVQKIRRSIFTLPFFLLLIWIPCVIFIFATITDRRVAGLVAGIGFIFIPLFNIFNECRSKVFSKLSISRITVSVLFVSVSALPIFLFRVFNWEKSLEEISIFGLITGRDLHHLSNKLYIVMLSVYLLTNIIQMTKNKNGAV
jgi:hypothetical protein